MSKARFLRLVIFAGVAMALTSFHLFAQRPARTASASFAKGRRLFVVAVKGDCGRRRPDGFIGRRECYFPLPPEDSRATLDPPRDSRISRRLEPDPKTLSEVMREMGRKKLDTVDSPAQADFILHVCSRYTYDVYPAYQLAYTFSTEPLPNRRLSTRALLLTPEAYNKYSTSYRDLLEAALWTTDAREHGIQNYNPGMRVKPGARGKEDQKIRMDASGKNGGSQSPAASNPAPPGAPVPYHRDPAMLPASAPTDRVPEMAPRDADVRPLVDRLTRK